MYECMRLHVCVCVGVGDCFLSTFNRRNLAALTGLKLINKWQRELERRLDLMKIDETKVSKGNRG